MKMKSGIFLVFTVLVLTGNSKAGVVGITPNVTPSGAAAKSDAIMSFNTTGLGGSRISGLSLYGNGNVAQSGAGFSITDGTTTHTGTFNIGANTASSTELAIAWSGGNWDLLANKTYTISLTLSSGTINNYLSINNNTSPYKVEPGISNYWASPTSLHTNHVAIQLYYDAASVPEPGTMILTGTALTAGAIGAYIKRRRKIKTKVAE
jgi:hypothetical protein